MPGHAPDVSLDIVELWVSSSSQMARALEPFGFDADDTVALESNPDDRVTCVSCGGVTIALRQGMSATSPVTRHAARHGDGVGNLRLVCSDIAGISARATARGVRVDRDAAGVRLDLLDDGAIRHSIHPTSVYRAGRPRDARAPAMLGVDHVTYCLPFGVMDRVADIYRQVFGLADVNVEGLTDVGDDEAGMRSVVLRSGGGFTVVLTEPRTAASVGQTQRFIDAHGGAGVQHIAVAYDSLSAVVPRLRSNGASFLPVPAEHLDASHSRMRDRLDNRSTLQREGILVDGDERGLLFQLFSKPVTERGTLFFELIQRDGATGFGAGNVRALFAAVEAGAHHRAGGSEGWSPALVRSSSERIPFYRDHLTGVDGHDFQAVPSFDKSMTTRYGRFPMSAGGAPGAFRVLATSGTSGHRLYVSFDEHEWRRTGRWLERAGRAAFVNADDVLLNTHCYGLWVGGPALDLLANRCGAGLIPLGPVSPSLVIELLRDGIGTAISATPSYMRRLVETAAAERCDLRRTPLRVGFIGAEPAETAFRQKLLSQLPDGFHWFELYGLTETGGPSVACAPDPSIPELILNTEEFLVEVLDPAADRPVPLGEVGELTITTRRADGRTPLVRYRTRDLVRATAGDINAPTRISRIIGRADQSLKIGGVLVYPSAVSEIMAELLPPSAEWRAIITRQNEDDELLIEAEAARDVCESVARAFRDRVGVGLTVTPMPAAAFARSREKTQRILVGSPAPVDAR